MKTISKILSIVLALTLVLGLATMVGAANASKTYTIGDYTAGTQYAANEEHKLDENVTVYTTECHFTSQLRIYSSSSHDGFAIIKSANVITGLSVNAGNKKDTLNVYGSTDGTNYTLIQAVSITSTSYNDYNVDIDANNAYKYLKLDVAGDQQVRVAAFTLKYVGACDHSSTSYVFDENTHTEKCSCGATVTPAAAHTYQNNPYGCDTCDYVKYPTGTTLTLDVAKKLGEGHAHNKYSTTKFTVTGVIKKVDNGQYGNIYIEDASGNEFYIYGTYDSEDNRYDAMTVKPVAGDTITVNGIIGQYNGNAQMKNGTVTNHVPAPVVCEHTTVVDYVCIACNRPVPPTADTKLTLPEAIKLGAAVGNSAYTDGKYYVTGVITKVENDTYGNLTIKDADGNTYLIYGSYSKDGANRYDALTDKPNEGDTITVYGVVGNYKGDAQMKNGWITEHVEGTPTDSDETGDNAMIAPMVIMMVLSAAAMAVVTINKKRYI